MFQKSLKFDFLFAPPSAVFLFSSNLIAFSSFFFILFCVYFLSYASLFLSYSSASFYASSSLKLCIFFNSIDSCSISLNLDCSASVFSYLFFCKSLRSASSFSRFSYSSKYLSSTLFTASFLYAPPFFSNISKKP